MNAGKLCLGMLLVFPLVWVSTVRAADAENYEQVHFQVERSAQVDNDRMQVRLAVQAEGEDPATLARQVNETMAWALKEAKNYQGITIRSGSYQTFPVRVKNIIASWNVSQELQLEGGDIPLLSELVGQLQTRLQVRSMAFSVSAEARRRVEDELIESALGAFRERAAKVQKSMSAKGYRLIAAHVQSGGQYPGPVPMMRASVADMESSMPAVSAGDSEMQVVVSGSIELQFP